MPAVGANQFRVYHSVAHGEHSKNLTNPSHNKNGLPVGFICWAFLSDEIDTLYGEGKHKLKPTDWNSGKNFWIIELIAPFGHGKLIISELRYKIFPSRVGKALMFSKDKKELRVVKVRGFGSNSTNTIEEKF